MNQGLGYQIGSLEVGIQGDVPIFRGTALQRGPQVGADIVDQDVECPDRIVVFARCC